MPLISDAISTQISTTDKAKPISHAGTQATPNISCIVV